MGKRFSAIDDMYGVGPSEEPSRQHGRLWPYAFLVVALFVIAESVRPVLRLRSDPPQSVIGPRLTSDEGQYQAQKRTAEVCWKYAARHVQALYPHGHALPKSPPQVARNAARTASVAIGDCWPRLRSVWTRRDSWVLSFEWSAKWISGRHSFFQEALGAIEDLFRMRL